MRAYYINLARRTDRRARMEAQFLALGLDHTRIAARPPEELPEALKRRYLPGGSHPRLSLGEFCCGVSHVAACRAFLASGDRYALILEDDIVLSPRLPAFLAAFSTRPMDIDLLRLETFASPAQVSVEPRETLGDFGLHSMHGWAWGSAAYIASRRLAETIAHDPRSLHEVIDRVLYRPHRSLFGSAKRRQLIPALAIQEDRLPGHVWGADSDIKPTNRAPAKISPIRKAHDFIEGEILTALPSVLHRLAGRSTKRDIPMAGD